MQVKILLVALLVLASAAMAQTKMSDAEIKKLIVGPWRSQGDSSDITEYKSDGTVVSKVDGKDVVEKWWIKDGALLETDASIDRTCYYKILFLTEREFLRLGMTVHVKGYIFQWRKDEDIPD